MAKGFDGFMRFCAVTTRPLRRALIRVLAGAARRHRANAHDTLFVGITGSYGKTTTKELVAAVLSRRYAVWRTSESLNSLHRAAIGILRAPRGGACVIEVATQTPGDIARLANILRPQIAVITNVMRDHLSAFRSREAIATEKEALVAALPANGVAVLNADDPLVMGMRARIKARVTTFGLSPTANVRAEQVASVWPNRLQFMIVSDAERCFVQTRLVGAFWITSVLAAVAVAREAGLSLHEAAEAISEVEPTRGRLNVTTTADGVTFIDDSWKGSVDSIPATLEVLRQARGVRRVTIFGTISDYSGSASPRYRDAAIGALDAGELVIFTNALARKILTRRLAHFGDRLLTFDHLHAAQEFLRGNLKANDLVVLKGSGKSDHLERFILAREDGIACWRRNCGRSCRCEDCRLRYVSHVPASSTVEDQPVSAVKCAEPATDHGSRNRR